MNMKAIKYLRYILPAFMLMAFASCQEEVYAPGEADLLECQGLYFPQDQAVHYELSPKGKLELTFTVQRNKADFEAYVPYEMESSVEGMFEMEDEFIYFDEDQKKATFKVYVSDDFELGENYSCTIKVTDPLYVSKYALSSSFLSFSVAVVDWIRVKSSNGSEDMGIWRDDFFTSLSDMVGAPPTKPYLEKEVEVYQRSDKPGYFRVDGIYTAQYISQIANGDNSAVESLKDYCPAESIYINATNHDKVYVDAQFTFYNPYNFYDGVLGAGVYMCSDVQEVFLTGYSNLYGKYKDGVITFPKKSLVLYLPVGIALAGNQAGKTRLVLPGHVGYDYGLSVSVAPAVSGVMPMTFTLDPDVAKVRYQVFEGHLTDVEMVSRLEEVKSGRNAVEITEAGEYDFSTSKSGLYTLIACSYDEKGGFQEYTTVKFGYDTAEDPRDVDIHLGLIVSDRHAAKGMTAENSMEFYVYGSDIKEAKVGLYKTSNYEDFKESLETQMTDYMPSLDNLQLDSLNRVGYTGVVSGLTTGTEYTLVVYADNGYHSGFFTAKATTEGVFDLMDAEYTVYDIPGRLQPAVDNHEPYLGEWQVWSLNPHTAKEWNRTHAATVTINDEADVMYDKDGKETRDPAKADFTVDYMSIEGMHPNVAKKAEEFNDVIDLEFYQGFVYTLMSMLDPMEYSGKTVYPTNYYMYYMGTNGMFWNLENGAMVGGFLTEEKDVIAFVANPSTSTSQYGYTCYAMQLCYFNNNMYGQDGASPKSLDEDAHGYPLLVRPDSKYAAYAGNSSSMALPSVYNRVSTELSRGRSNYVETERGYIRSTIDKITGAPYNYIQDAVITPMDMDVKMDDVTGGIEFLDRILK